MVQAKQLQVFQELKCVFYILLHPWLCKVEGKSLCSKKKGWIPAHGAGRYSALLSWRREPVMSRGQLPRALEAKLEPVTKLDIFQREGELAI